MKSNASCVCNKTFVSSYCTFVKVNNYVIDQRGLHVDTLYKNAVVVIYYKVVVY